MLACCLPLPFLHACSHLFLHLMLHTNHEALACRKRVLDEAEAEARSYASTRFGVPFRAKHLPESSPLAYHHSARMTGAVRF